MDIGLYVHVPFCASKCGYCDFYSQVAEPGQFEPLVDALLTELEWAVWARGVRVETIFVGGGTPTILPMEQLRRLFVATRRIVAEHSPTEFTVEANPATLTIDKAQLLRDCGVTRISMGGQSFHADELRVLGRLHHPSDLAPSAEVVHRAGFEHLNLDLIFGIPGQTLASWVESMRRAVALGPDHLAGYGLTYEPGTPLRAKRDAGLIQPVDEELEARMYQAAMDLLPEAGFGQYEISNYAQPQGRCRHNLRYWRNEPVIGIGPSAASYYDGRRWRNVPDTAQYVRRVRAAAAGRASQPLASRPLAVEPPTINPPTIEPSTTEPPTINPLAIESLTIETEALSPLRRAGETAMLMLRLNEGLSCESFRRATGFDAHQLFAGVIARHTALGLLTADGERIALTGRGRMLADTVIAEFLAPEPV